MHRIQAILLICVSQFLASTSYAQGQDGSFYLQACSAAVKQSDGGSLSAEDGAKSIFCIGYVAGFLDAHSLATAQGSAQKVICTPQRGITNDQAIRVFDRITVVSNTVPPVRYTCPKRRRSIVAYYSVIQHDNGTAAIHFSWRGPTLT